MFDFMGRILRDDGGSKDRAVERLRLVLIHDRAKVAPQLMQSLKVDLIETISKYMEIDEEGLEVSFDSNESSTALIASIPIKRMKRFTDPEM